MTRTLFRRTSVAILAAVATGGRGLFRRHGVRAADARDLHHRARLALPAPAPVRLPTLLALAVTMTLTILAMLVFASLVAWGFGRVGGR